MSYLGYQAGEDGGTSGKGMDEKGGRGGGGEWVQWIMGPWMQWVRTAWAQTSSIQ